MSYFKMQQRANTHARELLHCEDPLTKFNVTDARTAHLLELAYIRGYTDAIAKKTNEHPLK